MREIDGSDETAVVFGPYRIHELIGTGGMAEVYRASREPTSEDDGSGNTVVIKRIKPAHAGDQGFVQMFVDEARLSAQLEHPNIVRVFEFGEQDGHHFIAMEYVDGLHLQGLHMKYAQQHGRPLPWQVALLVVRAVLRALDYAHCKRDPDGRPMALIHRDINLVNIMVSRAGEVKLLDFGIVKAAEGIRSMETVGAVLKGKFGYMSPEQAEGRPLDCRSDVFAAAIVMHELLTGRRLFWGKDDLEILRRVREGEIPDPRQHAPDVPEDLLPVLSKGLERGLDSRYQSAGAMADDLDRVAASHRVSPDTVKDLMEQLLGGPSSKLSNRMARRRRKVTMAAWRQGVSEKEPSPRQRSVAGAIDSQDAQQTAVGRRTSAYPRELRDHSLTEKGEDTLIASQVTWMTVDGEAVLSEQALVAIEESELAEELAEELERETSRGGPPEGEHAHGQSSGSERAPSLGLLAAETKILEETSRGSLEAAETRILDDAAGSDLSTAETLILEDDQPQSDQSEK